MKIIILAGGEGKRLRPISTEKFPKQFVHFGDHDSLLKKTVRRFLQDNLIKETYIVTNEQYVSSTLEEIKEFDPSFSSRLLVEPYRKNTAPAIAWSIRELLQRNIIDKNEKIITIPIDHVFSDEQAFLRQLLEAVDVLNPEEIMAFGVRCRYPATGYGYIKQGKELDKNSFEVERFIEKPVHNIAKKLFKEEKWLWNIGVYLFSAQTYWKELSQSHKILYQVATGQEYKDENYKCMDPISIDHAVVTVAENLRVTVLENTEWSDIGSWKSLYEFLATRQNSSSIQLGNIGHSITKRLIALNPVSTHTMLSEPAILETDKTIFISHGI